MAELSLYLELALSMADIARVELSDSGKGAKASVATKADNSPYTAKDLSCEQQLRELLSREVPDHAIWGEEFGRHDGNYQWILDPIDGSISYISGSPLYSTLIGLLIAGQPALGVIEVPALGLRWYGSNDQPCYRHDQQNHPTQCRSSTTSRLSNASAAITLPPVSAKVRNLLNDCGYVRYGGDAFNFGCVADGTLDLAIEEGLKPYDWLPFVAVLEAAGASISDFDGNTPHADGNGNIVAAGNSALHAAALDALGCQD